jgi:hypothetical protein
MMGSSRLRIPSTTATRKPSGLASAHADQAAFGPSNVLISAIVVPVNAK